MSAHATDIQGKSTGSGMAAMADASRKWKWKWNRARAAALTALTAIAVAATCVATAHGEPHGANYGLADAEGAALPGAKAFWAGACDLHAASTGAGGVGTAPSSLTHCIDSGVAALPPLPWEDTWAPGQAPSWRLDPYDQAGGHPDATTMFWMRRSPNPHPGWSTPQSDGDTKTVIVKLPPGVVGNPNAVPKCGSEHMDATPVTCPPETQVGVSRVSLGQTSPGGEVKTTLHPVYNAEPRDGKTAEFIFSPSPAGGAIGQGANIPIVARARTDEDFGVDAVAINIPGGVPLLGQTITIWGVPWAASHDIYRPRPGYLGVGSNGGIPESGLDDSTAAQEPQRYSPDWGPIEPFFTNPTECAPQAPITEIQLESWQNPGTLVSQTAPADTTVKGCDKVPFDSDLRLSATSTLADAPTGLSADLEVPQNDEIPLPIAEDPDDDTGAPAYWKSDAGLAASQLDKVVVTLPEGFAVNPAGAAGLQGCSDHQIGLVADGNPPRFDDEDPFDGAGRECPAGSKIGSAQLYTPLLPGDPGEPNMTGDVVLGMPRSTDPESGEMFRLFVVMRNAQRALVAKIAGSAVAKAASGQLTATFDKNPRIPFETLHVDFKGGQRATLATPQRCVAGGRNWAATMSPWTAAHGAGGEVDFHGGGFATNARCGFGFAPDATGGMSSQQAGGHGTFSFRFSRDDGEQWFRGVTASLPQGLLASLRGVPLCTDAQANAGSCPAGSRVGSVDAGAGSGLPYFLEKKGDVYLTEGYKGAPYGLMVRVPVEAGPFTGRYALTPIVVRQALHVDRTTAKVTAVSDPFPQIWHGIPLRARQITVRVDRPGFMRNPTDCSPKQIGASIASANGAIARVGVPFGVTRCASLGFRPKLRLDLKGRRQIKTGRHPAIRARLTQPAGQAGIAKAVVRLPGSLALDPDNARALCEFEDGTKPDLERHCPRGSIVGRARARTPLLNEDLVGNVYFVKNVRRDPRTGNEIRTLPMIIVALRGEIAINLRGESDTTRDGRLINTFAAVPDAPVSRFNLNIRGGRNGILAVTRTRKSIINLCKKPRSHVAEVDFDGQNGKRHDVDVRMRPPCPKPRARKSICRKTKRKSQACKRAKARARAQRRDLGGRP